jgi:hypothetical protein
VRAAEAAGVATAKQAGAVTRPEPEAYGRLCTVVPVLLGELQVGIVDGVDAAVQSLTIPPVVCISRRMATPRPMSAARRWCAEPAARRDHKSAGRRPV